MYNFEESFWHMTFKYKTKSNCSHNLNTVCNFFFRDEKCNGVVLWAEYQFTDQLKVSLGPQEKVIVGEKVEWDFYSKQGIHLLTNKGKNFVENLKTIDVSLTFKPTTGDFDFIFKTKTT